MVPQEAKESTPRGESDSVGGDNPNCLWSGRLRSRKGAVEGPHGKAVAKAAIEAVEKQWKAQQNGSGKAVKGSGKGQ